MSSYEYRNSLTKIRRSYDCLTFMIETVWMNGWSLYVINNYSRTRVIIIYGFVVIVLRMHDKNVVEARYNTKQGIRPSSVLTIEYMLDLKIHNQWNFMTMCAHCAYCHARCRKDSWMKSMKLKIKERQIRHMITHEVYLHTFRICKIFLNFRITRQHCVV